MRILILNRPLDERLNVTYHLFLSGIGGIDQCRVNVRHPRHILTDPDQTGGINRNQQLIRLLRLLVLTLISSTGIGCARGRGGV